MIDWSAGTYELTAAQLAPAAERAVAAARITPGERVLDVACGTGNAALLAAMGGAQVTGVDRAERLLEVAAGRARAAGVAVDWRAGDALALPVEDDAFDAVLSVFGVIFADAEPAVAELVRVAAPEGRIVLVTWTREGVIAAGSGVVRRAVAQAGPATDGDAGPAPRDWGDPAQLEALFAPHDGVVTVERYAHAFEAASPEAFADEWMDRHPLWLAARDVLGPDAYAALRDPLVAVLAEGNEDPDAFRGTSTALVVHVQLP
jgi:SAM-dependent methyltransferase